VNRLPDGARIERGPGGLERLALQTPAGEAVVYLQGAHVAAFHPRGEREVLWTSAESLFAAGKPIRGGVPICFPWFGPKAGAPEAPMHGFARLLPWTVAAVRPEPEGRLHAVFELPAGAAARAGFPGALSLSLAVTVGRSLHLALTVRNPGAVGATFEEALHSYFAVSDVRQVRLHGLAGVGFVDKTAAMARKAGEEGPLALAAWTDRVYLGATGTVTIEDPGGKRRLVVAKSGSATTVVWNPWAERAKAMADFGDDEWPGMVCVETANALEDAVALEPGGAHVMTATVEVAAG
jgi:D-hexose-6-phosphate mutarotase